ncbi:hypothetical protein VTJ49DRAFT_5905 [Mycothermus thermophilus]|uniref:Uncharacterized protein n=1 Tax=Humicola insolens TaxID=85995 RepID=A0ABR3V2G9_HUMIN
MDYALLVPPSYKSTIRLVKQPPLGAACNCTPKHPTTYPPFHHEKADLEAAVTQIKA